MRSFSWSYTALNDYENCPRAYAAKRFYKTIKEEQSEALLWGNQVHKALEDRLMDKTPLPATMREYEKWPRVIERATGIRKMEAEREMALSRDLTIRGWFDRDVWCRGKVDVLLLKDGGMTAKVLDYKTGAKIKDDKTQLMIFGLILMAMEPTIQRVFGQNIWLKHDKVSPEHPVCVTRDTYHSDWREILVRVNRMEEACKAENFPARESGLFKRHCPVFDCPSNGRRG
jgi:RecB family exonuclease